MPEDLIPPHILQLVLPGQLLRLEYLLQDSLDAVRVLKASTPTSASEWINHSSRVSELASALCRDLIPLRDLLNLQTQQEPEERELTASCASATTITLSTEESI